MTGVGKIPHNHGRSERAKPYTPRTQQPNQINQSPSASGIKPLTHKDLVKQCRSRWQKIKKEGKKFYQQDRELQKRFRKKLEQELQGFYKSLGGQSQNEGQIDVDFDNKLKTEGETLGRKNRGPEVGQRSEKRQDAGGQAARQPFPH